MGEGRSAPRALIMLATLVFASQSGAFVRDTHYVVTFGLALTTCFDWDEAHLIASADFMIDQNKTTKAESNPLKKQSKVGWHAFSHPGERYLELWDRTLAERDPDLQLVKFGQFLHFLQAWESHAGFGSKLGHAAATVTGHDPDSMARSELRTRAAHNDPTRVLDPVRIDFVGDAGSVRPAPGYTDRVWSITPEGRFVPPAAKCYDCIRPRDLCSAIPDSDDPPALRFSVEAGAGENETLVPLDGELGDDVRNSCDAASRATFVQTSDPVGEEPVGLRVLTFNVWHGLRSGESKTKFPGEDEARKERRFAWQIRLIRELDPDVLFFQEVNPNQREAATYARALGFEEIHKVTSCGIHLPPIKIPKNVNEGLAILARPGLRLRRVQTKRLSGDAKCTATFGFQTKESRYVLLGEITVEGRKVLLATTHLSSPPYVPPGFEDDLQDLLDRDLLTEGQHAEIVDKLDRKRARNLSETRKLLGQIDKYRRRLSEDGRPVPVILGGDFNTEPDTDSIAAVADAGLQIVASGPDYLTWDPVRNHENQEIGSKRGWPLPTFDLEEIERLLAPRATTARQIDYLFVSEQGRVVRSRMAMDQERHGLFPSDHFGIFAVIDLELDPPELEPGATVAGRSASSGDPEIQRAKRGFRHHGAGPTPPVRSASPVHADRRPDAVPGDRSGRVF